jgi:hypothetical protein
MPWFTSFINALGGIVTKRTSIFTPLLTLNTIVISFSCIIYWKSNTLWIFIPALILLAYSIYRHERYAKEMPHMLSTETIQRLGMNLRMGNNRTQRTEESIDAMQPVTNPEIVQGEVVMADREDNNHGT